MGWLFESASKAKKKRVFLSFIKEDEPSVNGLRLLKANDDFDIEFYDESVKTPINSENSAYIKSQIKDRIARSSVTVCLISEDTHNSAWVDWELEESERQGNTIIAMALKGVDRAVLPALIKKEGLAFHPWDYKVLASLIEQAP